MIDFENRLKSLKDRRQGTRERAILESLNFNDAVAALTLNHDIRKSESFEKIKESNGVKYAIGAMAPVDPHSTQISIREGERVAKSIVSGLVGLGESVTYKMQGSVALDVHIKGHSDVDMLIIVTNPISVESPCAVPSKYIPSSDTRSFTEILRDIRSKSEQILDKNFTQATVDKTKDKCIRITGGSLARDVDVVPSVWYDSIDYQKSQDESYRGIMIYDKSNNTLPKNYPFLHIKRVNDRDAMYHGNLKCVIRLMKNMIADMPTSRNEKASKLSSFDLAGIAFNMDNKLNVQSYMRLSLIEKTRAHLQYLLDTPSYRNSITVPDQTRKIFNADEKVEALRILTEDFSDLALSIFKELKPLHNSYDSSVILNKALIL